MGKHTVTSAPKPVARAKKTKKPVKQINAKRKKREWERCYHSKERVEWVKSQPCVLGCSPPSENAHIETGGTGRKADYTKIVPLCGFGHRQLHGWGRKRFEECYEINLAALAADTERRWLARNDGT